MKLAPGFEVSLFLLRPREVSPPTLFKAMFRCRESLTSIRSAKSARGICNCWVVLKYEGVSSQLHRIAEVVGRRLCYTGHMTSQPQTREDASRHLQGSPWFCPHLMMLLVMYLMYFSCRQHAVGQSRLLNQVTPFAPLPCHFAPAVHLP